MADTLAQAGVDASTGATPEAAGKCCGGSGVAAAAPALPTGPLDLPSLIEHITAQLQYCKEMHLSKRTCIQELLRLFDPTLGELDRYIFFEPSKKYTRNLVATDNETFTLMLLCWTPGKESPIHDHPCDGCFVRVVNGVVEETRYRLDAATNALVQTQQVVAKQGDVTYIDDSMGLHKVANPSSTEGACTLHLYSPPFRQCSIWLDATRADKCLKPTVTYHSEYGQLVDYESSKLCE